MTANPDIGSYILASKQTGLLNKLAVLSNNSANSNTSGYQSDHILFTSFMENNGIRQTSYVNDIATYRNVQSGSIAVTNNPLDVAISGDGYFSVATAAGIRYRRAGNFTLDAAGTLITHEGYNVLDNANQPIVIPAGTNELKILADGTITVDGEMLAQLGVVSFEEPQRLSKVGNSLYRSEVEPENLGQYTLVQGALEDSNVAITVALNELIDTERAITMGTNVMNDIHEMINKTIQVFGGEN